MKEIEKPFLTQYCNLILEWHSTGHTIDTVGEAQQTLLCELREKTILQSGLTWNELVLISLCRKHRIFNRVNTYAHSIKMS